MSDAGLARLIVSLEAKIDAYEKNLDKAKRAAYGAAGEIKKSLDSADSRWGKLFGATEPGKALDNVFTRSRLAVFEEGAAKVPIFGSAVEALGPAGFAAAAGIGALVLTMERTEKAVDYAAGIAKLGRETGATTDFVQAFNFAARQSEVDVGAADMSLKNLNASLGAVQGNLPRARQLAVTFKDALGLTPDQLRGYKDVSELLPVIADRIQHAGSAAEQAAIARKLGIEDLLPLLREGSEEFTKLIDRARELGIVMDASTIQRAEEAKKKLNELDQVMKAQSNITFAEYAGTLVTIKEGFLGAERAALRFLAALTNTTPLAERLAKLEADRAQVASGVHNYGMVDKERLAELDREIAVLKLHASIADLLNAPPKADAGDAKQFVPDKAGKGKKPKTKFDFEAQTAFDPVTGKPIKPKTLDELMEEAIGGPKTEPVKIDAEVDLKPTLGDQWAESQKQLHDGVQTAVSEGLNAAFNGHFFDWLKQRLMASALEGLTQALSKIISEQASESGIRAVLSVLGIPGFAGGTSYAPGGMAWVGENGPELVNLPKGSQVVPSGGVANAVRGGGATQYFDLRGAVVTEELYAHMQAVADSSARLHAGVAARAAKADTLETLSRMRSGKMGR